MSLPPGRPKEGDVPLGGTARSAREPIQTTATPRGNSAARIAAIDRPW